jgi:hypothetical protein
MAIGDPTTDKSSRRKGRRRTNKSGASKNYSPGFFEMAITFLNKTPREAGLFDASPKSAKGRAKAKKLKDNIRDAGTKRNIQEVISRSEKAQKKKDSFKGLDAPKGDKKFNVGVSKGGVPFKEAFAHFRKKGAKTFTWNGKKYTTELAKPKGKK